MAKSEYHEIFVCDNKKEIDKYLKKEEKQGLKRV